MVAGASGVVAPWLLVLVEMLVVLVLVPVMATGIDRHACMLAYVLVFQTTVIISMLLLKCLQCLNSVN